MADEGVPDKDTFLRMAEAAGLDLKDEAHMDALYNYLEGLLPSLKSIHEIDVTGAEPAMVYVPAKK